MEKIEKFPEPKLSEQEVNRVKEAFEKLAERLKELWQKDSLTGEEQREVDLILNNAVVAQEIIEGKIPEEFEK